MSKYGTLGTTGVTALVGLIKGGLNGKGDKVEGRGLSANGYTNDEKTKLAGIAEGADKTVIVDGLTSTDAASALSANQGKVLDDKITAVSEAVNVKVSSTYKAGGSVAFASLPAADEAHLGMVYNVTDAFTTTDAFLDGAGKSCPAGTNVVIAADGDGYKYDALAGFVDLSGYVASADLQEMTAEEVTSLWNGVTA